MLFILLVFVVEFHGLEEKMSYFCLLAEFYIRKKKHTKINHVLAVNIFFLRFESFEINRKEKHTHKSNLLILMLV